MRLTYATVATVLSVPKYQVAEMVRLKCITLDANSLPTTKAERDALFARFQAARAAEKKGSTPCA